METVILRNKAFDGTPLEATFSSNEGINLLSYRRGDIEVMDTSTTLPGRLIGPHYGNRHAGIIPPLPNGFVKLEGMDQQDDPFHNGIARCGPWVITNDASTCKGTLTGKQEWQGQPLSVLEGQQFTMAFQAVLNPEALTITISVVSDADSVVGLDYRFRLPKGHGSIHADVKDSYHDGKSSRAIPPEWNYDDNRRLALDLNKPIEATFHPFFNPLQGNIQLNCTDYTLDVLYSSHNEENAWQLAHTSGASHVSLRPLSAKMPFRPCLTVSSLTITLAIRSGNNSL